MSEPEAKLSAPIAERCADASCSPAPSAFASAELKTGFSSRA